MSVIKSLFGLNGQAITCTFTSLASNGQRSSAAIDNTANLYLDVLVQVKIKTNAAGTSASGYVNVYAYATADGGTDYTDAIAGTDSTVTLSAPPNVRPIGVITCNVNATTYIGGPMSVAAAFGGILPDHWGIVIENKTNAALDASVGSAWYQGIYQQVV